jgi:hypothetical protein
VSRTANAARRTPAAVPPEGAAPASGPGVREGPRDGGEWPPRGRPSPPADGRGFASRASACLVRAGVVGTTAGAARAVAAGARYSGVTGGRTARAGALSGGARSACVGPPPWIGWSSSTGVTGS